MKPVELVVQQTVVSVRLLVRMQPVDSGCLNSDTMGALSSSSPLIGLLGLQALRGHLAPLPAIFGPDRSSRPSQRRVRGSASKASCPLPATWCSISDKGYISFSIPSTLGCPSREQVKDMEPAQLLPVISFSLLPSRPHGERG